MFSFILYLLSSRLISFNYALKHITCSLNSGIFTTSSLVATNRCSAFFRIRKAKRVLFVSFALIRSTAIWNPRVAYPCYFRICFLKLELTSFYVPSAGIFCEEALLTVEYVGVVKPELFSTGFFFFKKPAWPWFVLLALLVKFCYG